MEAGRGTAKPVRRVEVAMDAKKITWVVVAYFMVGYGWFAV